MTCFYGIIYGLFSISASSNHYKAILEGQAAAKFAFEIIDRNPEIN